MTLFAGRCQMIEASEISGIWTGDGASPDRKAPRVQNNSDGRRSLPFGWAGQSASISASRGAPILDVLLDAGMGGARGLIDEQTEVSAAQYMLMGVGTVNLVEDEIHGVSRTKMQRGTVSTGLKIMASARSLQNAIESLSKFYGLMRQAEKINLAISGPVARVEVVSGVEDRRVGAAVEEMIAVSLHCQFGFVLGRSLSLLGFATPGDHPKMNLEHPYLGCPISRGATTALLFSTAYLELEPSVRISETPITDAVLDWLDRIAARDCAAIDRRDLKPLGAAVFDLLRDRDLSYAECCRQMRLHGDELRRRLFSEGTGYRVLRHGALLERLRPHLVSGANMDDIALAVGFSDARSLRRSVRSASGMSLADLRQNANLARPVYDPLTMSRLKSQLIAME